jgi:hypothetical protein
MDEILQSKEARLKAKIERIEKMFPNPVGAEKAQVEAALEKAKLQLAQIQKASTKEEEPEQP